ncbi:PIR Superfamily Protein [Plasmodium ovale curtisi]|uniref:PIR Superfamily Protein n=1 Tax=Plasmodium ovale curtisi TaxID=864141 RepID=A0A1A8X6I6_PLAOA|nr:PIR Superfamily Protein [Plasmodium ovale curtisi]SBT00864.1 PIR Superfamily Protein [Plasmodium ovale curtisi]
MEIIEDELIPNIFYAQLSNTANKSILDNLISFKPISTLIKYEETNKILAKIARNLYLIRTDYSDNYRKHCRDMDYWIDEEISTYTCKEQHEDIAPFISAIYNDIKWSTGSKD